MNKRIFAFALVLLLLACGRAGGEVVFAPESTLTPTEQTPTPEPTPTPVPAPYRELEETYFPVLAELRKIPGNEGARVDWGAPDRRFPGNVYYNLLGVKMIPRALFSIWICQAYPDRSILVGFSPPRNTISTMYGLSEVTCTEDGAIIHNPEKGILISFIIYSKGDYLLPPIPQWDGPPPP